MTTDNGMSDEDKLLYEQTKDVKYEKEDQQYDGVLQYNLPEGKDLTNYYPPSTGSLIPFEKAITQYQSIDNNNKYTLFKLKPITGRKHQIRKHLTDLNCPIVGDKKYFIYKPSKNNQLMLHAYEIKFILNNKKFTFKANIPEYFKQFLIKNNLKQKDF